MKYEMQDRLHLCMYRGIWRIYIQFTPKHCLLHLAYMKMNTNNVNIDYYI